MAAEAKGIGDGDVDLSSARDIGHVVQIRFRIWCVVVNGRRKVWSRMASRQNMASIAPAAPKQVAGHRLGGTDGQLVGMVAEDILMAAVSAGVIEPRAGAVGIDVVHAVRGQTRRIQRLLHGQRRCLSPPRLEQ